ncbi:hypothetical protein G210_3320 [Candida maltosa Xu316]|uniref:COMPASS component SDC1 n=1 Tax=Candida maltosa (strain Xu316) TaxID=1245528 RepID=M3IJ73_CANMX|nr:hypothetical protein G210_3320 [Candida maltosa Xu316]
MDPIDVQDNINSIELDQQTPVNGTPEQSTNGAVTHDDKESGSTVSRARSTTPAGTSKKTKMESSITPALENQPPMHEIVGGSSVRRYLNEHVTKALLEGLKEVGHVKPEDPLKYLGEFLITKSQESKD